MPTQPNGFVNAHTETAGFVPRMKGRIPYFRQKLRFYEPVTGSFLKVCRLVKQ